MNPQLVSFGRLQDVPIQRDQYQFSSPLLDVNLDLVSYGLAVPLKQMITRSLSLAALQFCHLISLF